MSSNKQPEDVDSRLYNAIPSNVNVAPLNDIQFDYFGRRVATCSTDHHIRIYEVRTKGDNGQTEYKETCAWKAHNASVWHISWAHPEYGQIIASCSLDRQVIVWQEILFKEYDDTKLRRSASPLKSIQWIKRVTFVDSRANVSDVRFAPRHLGLMVAFTSFDGSFRVYEVNNTRNLSVWSLQAEVPIESEDEGSSKSTSPDNNGTGFVWLPALCCLAWSTSRQGLPVIAVGVDRSVQYGQATPRRIPSSNFDPSHLQFWQAAGEFSNPDAKKWKRVDNLNVTERVRDVSFAPCHGRSFHLIAAALEHEIILYSLTLSISSRKYDLVTQKIVSIHKNQHSETIERIRWNVTGSVIMSIDSKGVVVASKALCLNRWEVIGSLPCKEPTSTEQ